MIRRKLNVLAADCDHEHVAYSYKNLGLAYKNLGDFRQGNEFIARAVDMEQRLEM